MPSPARRWAVDREVEHVGLFADVAHEPTVLEVVLDEGGEILAGHPEDLREGVAVLALVE